MDNVILNKVYDEERALYNLKNSKVMNCKFAGPKDGESVLKECRDILVENCSFSLRYPLWHVKGFRLVNSSMDDKTRAPIWYGENGLLEKNKIYGIKCLRECSDIVVRDCEIISPEFGWKSNNIKVFDSFIEGEYLFLDTNNVEISNLKMRGKYSFQYMENLVVKDSELDTKDAFWHSKNIVVENSLVKGEYLGWFSENLTFINCKIIGTQPLCYCKNLKLINCTMENTDLAFEYSDVEAEIFSHVVSIKNPKSGLIKVKSVGELIFEDAVMDCCGKVECINDSINKECEQNFKVPKQITRP